LVLFSKEKSSYEIVGLKINFYRSPNVNCIVLNNDDEFSNYLYEHKTETAYLLERKISATNNIVGYKKENVYCFFPDWVLYFNINNWQERSRIWNIQRFKKLK
jgi:hypothetical protein